MNKQKGITLIALIITIIVMLILVAVTINVALNGGLFDKAKTASDQTQRQVSKEQLISAMVGAYSSNGSFIVADVELPEGAKWCTEEDEEFEEVDEDIVPVSTGNWIITKENNKFYVDASGTVLDQKLEATNPWIEWGLTSPKVKYNVSYKGTVPGQSGLSTIILYDDGRLYLSWDNKTYNKEEVESMIETKMGTVEDNIWYLIVNNAAFVFEKETGENGEEIPKADIYMGGTADLNDLEGSLVKNGTHSGTLIAQN